MPRVWIEHPRLTDGVSQQPDSRRYRSQADEIKNAWMSVVDGLDKRTGTTHVAKIGTVANTANYITHWMDIVAERIDVDPATGNATTPVAAEQYLLYGRAPQSGEEDILQAYNVTDGAEIHIEDTASASAGGTLAGTKPDYDYLDSGINVSARENLKFLTVADHTFIVNRSRTCAMDTAVKTTAPAFGEGYIYVRSGNYELDYDITIETATAGATTVTTTTWDGVATTAQPEPATPPVSPQATVHIRTDDIAEDLRGRINALTGVTATRVGSIIKIVGSSGESLVRIEAHDGVGDTSMEVLFEEISTAVALPLTCTDGFKIRVTGDPAIGGDDYFIKFVAKDSTVAPTPSDGVWEQTIDHGTEYQFDADTMPHRLIRRISNGSALPSGYTPDNLEVYFEFSTISWNERETGDEELVPDPSFIGQSIENVILARNRLVFLADDNVVMSEVNGFFNFWRTDLTNLLDSDSIDVSVGHSDVSFPRLGISFENDMILWTDRNQFRVPGEDPLTPKTVSVRHITSYRSDQEVEPVVSGTGVYFAQYHDQFSVVMELYRRGDSNFFGAADLCEQVPRYIPGRIREMTASTSSNALAVVLDDPTATNLNKMYVYNFHWQDNKRIQSSWNEWSFGEAEEILSAKFIEDKLYVLLQRNDQIYLEYIDTNLGGNDLLHDFRIKMDRKAPVAGSTGVYSLMTNLTTFALPYDLDEDDVVQVMTWSFQVDSQPSNAMLNVSSVDRATPGAHKVLVVGDYTGITNLFVGTRFDFEYTFGSILHKEPTQNGERAIHSGPNQVLDGLLAYDDSGPFEVQITPRNDATTYTYEPDMRVLNDGLLGDFATDFALSSGEMLFPVLCDARSVTIKIVNRLAYPSPIQRAEWSIESRPRHRRVQ